MITKKTGVCIGLGLFGIIFLVIIPVVLSVYYTIELGYLALTGMVLVFVFIIAFFNLEKISSMGLGHFHIELKNKVEEANKLFKNLRSLAKILSTPVVLQLATSQLPRTFQLDFLTVEKHVDGIQEVLEKLGIPGDEIKETCKSWGQSLAINKLTQIASNLQKYENSSEVVSEIHSLINEYKFLTPDSLKEKLKDFELKNEMNKLIYAYEHLYKEEPQIFYNG